jgi:hypothetical protein
VPAVVASIAVSSSSFKTEEQQAVLGMHGWIVCRQIEARRMGRQQRFEETSRFFVARRQQIVCGMTALLSAN